MISVNNALPHPYTMVWVLLEGGITFNQAFVYPSGDWQYNWRVTHWNTEKPSELPYIYKTLYSFKQIEQDLDKIAAKLKSDLDNR